MRHGRHLVAAALAGPLALGLVAASAPSTDPAGTAHTTLSAAQLTVGDATVRLVDADTFASTDVDPAVNPHGGPFARAGLTPLTGPAGPVGSAEARSDGERSVDVVGSSLAGIGGPLVDVSGTVSPATLTARAAAGEAHAAVDTLTARIAGLADALGVEVDVTAVASDVTTTGASAVQGLRVSDVEVALGDVVPADILATLPLPDLLALLDALPVELPSDVQQLIDTLRTLLDQLTAQLATVSTTGEAVAGTLTEIDQLADSLAALETLTAQQQALAGVDLSSPDAGETLTGIGNTVDDAVDTLTGGVDGIVALSTGTTTCVPADQITDAESLQRAVDCVAAVIAAELDELGVASIAELQQELDALVVELETLVGELLTAIGGLEPLLGDVTTAALSLDDLLARIDSLITDVAGLPLVRVSAFDLGLDAVSDGTVDGSSAVVRCQPVTVTVLTETVSTPSCEDGLSSVTDATALVDGLLGSLAGALNSLPVADVVTTGDLRVDLYTDLVRSVEERDDEVVATAGVTALDLQLPSITIDPAPVTDLLGLGLPDVLTTVETLLAELLAQAGSVDLAELDPVTATLQDATGATGVAGTLADVMAELEAILAGLDLSDLGTLESFTTPSVALVVDPVSTAAFAPGTKVPASGSPAPETPSLPHTGGGLGLLGLATLAGAFGLRRLR